MSRAKIALVVAVVMLALSATAYNLTTSKLEARIKEDVKRQVAGARDLLVHTQSFEALDLIKRAEAYARTPALAQALAQTEPKQMQVMASQGIREALANQKQGEDTPDFLAVLNKEGQLVAIDPAGTFDGDWKGKYPAVASVLETRRAVKDIWLWENATMNIAAAPVVDRTTNEVLGAVVVSYSLDADEAAKQATLLRSQVAFFFDGKVRATSFGKSGTAQDAAIEKVLFGGGMAQGALDAKDKRSEVKEVSINGETYMAGAAALPLNINDKTSGAVVMMSLSGALDPVSSVKLTILLIGLAGLVLAVLGIFLTARFILAPAEEIEMGVTEIINGNTDYTFRPAGADFDGLANALNVMLARLLGRPEPGEEEYDENGNVIGGTARVQLGDADPATSEKNAEALQLANEPEADYYRRVYNEYIEARKAAGEKVEGVNFEGFTAKLRMNEANLKKKYNAKAVRFKVQVAGGQVTLKPVPIL